MTTKLPSLEYIQAQAVQAIGRGLRYLNMDNRTSYVAAIPKEVEEPSQANVITSLLPNGNHAPCIDLDFPAHLVPSTTPGHFHLYLEQELSWSDYEKLLKAMNEVGLIEDGYLKRAVEIKQTILRLPYVKKPPARKNSFDY